MKAFFNNTEIVNYYKYSLIPKKVDFMFIFGDNWEVPYNEAILNQEKPSLEGFIKYYKDFIKRNEETKHFNIIKRKKND